MAKSAFKMAGWSGYQNSPISKKQDKEKQYTTSGLPENLYDADGNKKSTTDDIDEGSLSEIKTETGTNRKYVEYTEGHKEGSRLYTKPQ